MKKNSLIVIGAAALLGAALAISANGVSPQFAASATPSPLDSAVLRSPLPTPTTRKEWTKEELDAMAITYVTEQFPDKNDNLRLLLTRRMTYTELADLDINLGERDRDLPLQVLLFQTDSDNSKWVHRKPDSPVMKVNYVLVAFDLRYGGLCCTLARRDATQWQKILAISTAVAVTPAPKATPETPVAAP